MKRHFQIGEYGVAKINADEEEEVSILSKLAKELHKRRGKKSSHAQRLLVSGPT